MSSLIRKLTLYSIVALSVYLQTYQHLYDAYLDYIDQKNYLSYRESLGQIVDQNRFTNNYTYVNNWIESYYIPEAAQSIRAYFKTSPIKSFHLSESVIGVYNRYAILEGAYPIQASEKSSYLITTSEANLAPSCSMLKSNGGIQIVYCP